MRPSVPAWRATLLFIRLRLLRLFNQTMALSGRFGGGRAAAGTGVVTKRRGRGLASVLIATLMVLPYISLARQAINRIVLELGDSNDNAMVAAAGASSMFGPMLQQAFTLELTLLLGIAMLFGLATRELSHAEWDLEWLATLPMSTSALLWARVGERTVANPAGVLVLWPTCTLLAGQCGHSGLASIGLGLAIALPLLALAAMGRTLVDTGLRLKLAPAALRNLQAMVSVGGLLILLLAISPATTAGTRFIGPLANGLPSVMAWSPPGLVVGALSSTDPVDTVRLVVLLVIQTAAALFAGIAALRRMLRHGVLAAGVREGARHAGQRQAPVRSAGVRKGLAALTHILTPVQRRELKLLQRDRAFLVQTLGLPLLLVASQWVLNGDMNSLRGQGNGPVGVAVASFTVAAYALFMSAVQTFNAEGGALWLLYTFPEDIARVLRQKALLWGAFALVYPMIGFSVQLAFGGWPDAAGLGRMAIMLAGVPIFSVIATALCVFAYNPMAQGARHRVRPTLLYAYMLIAGIYAFAVSVGLQWRSLLIVLLAASLARALWQKASDKLPYLLDPSVPPPGPDRCSREL